MQPNTAEFLAGFDLAILDAGTQTGGACDPGSAAGRSWGGGRVARLSSGVRAPAASGGQALSASEIWCAWHVSWAESLTSIACLPNACCSCRDRMARSAWLSHRHSTPMRARQASASFICEQTQIENDACRSKTGRAVRYPRQIQIRPGRCAAARADARLCGALLSDRFRSDRRARASDGSTIGTSSRIRVARYATLLELRDRQDLRWRDGCSSVVGRLALWMDDAGISLSREIHMTDDASRFHVESLALDRRRQPGRSEPCAGAAICCCMKARRFTSSAIVGIRRRDTRSAWPTLADKPQVHRERSLLPRGLPRDCPIDR